MLRMSNLSIIQKTYLIIISLVTVSVILFSIYIGNNYLEREKEVRAEQIYHVAELLEREVSETFEDILIRQDARGKSKEEKIKIINKELQPIIMKISAIFPKLGIGYYSIGLDSVVAIGPNFSPELLVRVPRTYPYFTSYQTGQPEYNYSGDSIGWYGKEIYSITYPIKRDGEIIGHSWANIKMDDIYSDVKRETLQLIILGKFLLVLLLVTIYLVFKNLRKQIKQVSNSIINDKPIKSNLIPELDALVNKFNEQRNYEKEIAKFDKLSIVGEMAATIAHEIRNPLTTIRGFLQLEKIENPHSKKYNLLINELDRANTIITEYLSLAKDKENKFVNGNLNDVIKDIFPLLQSDALKANKLIELDLNSIPNLFIDISEIKQLIFNIARNGLEAMEERKSLTIRTIYDGKQIILAIADQGTGIDPEILSKIGTPFVTTKINGNGLGLPVCYKIADKHHALIEIDTSSTGTTFYIKFTP